LVDRALLEVSPVLQDDKPAALYGVAATDCPLLRRPVQRGCEVPCRRLAIGRRIKIIASARQIVASLHSCSAVSLVLRMNEYA
jgi:hypothetical protein